MVGQRVVASSFIVLFQYHKSNSIFDFVAKILSCTVFLPKTYLVFIEKRPLYVSLNYTNFLIDSLRLQIP